MYNDLRPVEQAHLELQQHGNFGDFLEAFSDLSASFGLDGQFGACLLHRHFLLPAGMAMVEHCGSVGGRAALIASPTAEDSKQASACRWRLDKSAQLFVGYEYSHDPAVSSDFSSLRGFVSEYASLLIQLNLDDLLGLAVAQRSHLQLGDGEYFYEWSTDQESIVVASSDASEHASFIETMWVPHNRARCELRGRCRQATLCRSRCRFGVDNRHRFDHRQEWTHNRVTDHQLS